MEEYASKTNHIVNSYVCNNYWRLSDSKCCLGKKHHHSSEDDGSISPSPSTTATPGSDSNPDCTPGVPSTTYCNAHDIGAGIREAAKGLGDGLTGK